MMEIINTELKYMQHLCPQPHKRCHSLQQNGHFIVFPLRWRGGATGKAFGLAISRSRVQILLEATLRNNLRQVVYICVSVTKQYNLVPAKGR